MDIIVLHLTLALSDNLQTTHPNETSLPWPAKWSRKSCF